jgi:hypothetical protein
MKGKVSFITNFHNFDSDEDFFRYVSQLTIDNKDFPCKKAEEFVKNFSKSILLDQHSRTFPELIVLANFFKREKIFLSSDKNKHNFIQTPLGKTFHIAPSNVDTIFLYSSLIALLCGNICLIRISSNKNPQLDFVIEKLNAVLSNHTHIQERLILFNYNHDAEITKRISHLVESRIIWGGDRTVKDIRSISMNPLAREIVFPNRFSLTIVKSSSILNTRIVSQDIIKGFFNDTNFFNQQACSSPKLIIWLGSDEDISKARNKFWNQYQDFISANVTNDTPGMAMDRFVASSFYTANDLVFNNLLKNDYPKRLEIKDSSSPLIRESHPGNGLFLEMKKHSIDEIAKEIRGIDQTLSYIGLSKKDITNLVMQISNRGVDKIVPVGKALDFNIIWDGYDLVEQFSRKIVID